MTTIAPESRQARIERTGWALVWTNPVECIGEGSFIRHRHAYATALPESQFRVPAACGRWTDRVSESPDSPQIVADCPQCFNHPHPTQEVTQ